MTRDQLVDTLRQHGCCASTKEAAARALVALFRAIRQELLKTGKTRVAGLGEFRIKRKKARRCYNPQDGEMHIIPERQVVKFFPDALVKNVVREGAIYS